MSDSVELHSQQEVEQAINTLKGVIQGLDIDREIDAEEIEGLKAWIGLYEPIRHLHPFNELLPVIESALEDHHLSAQEKADILWLCGQFSRKSGYLDRVSRSLQEMNGVLAGVLMDGELNEEEVFGLKRWLDKNQHLKTIWPYDEINSLVHSIIDDFQVTSDELSILQDFLATFLGMEVGDEPGMEPDDVPYSLTGVCAKDPVIELQGKTFCFTGFHSELTPQELKSIVQQRGGSVVDEVDETVDYLVVGSEGNPCWAYACYGRKIEQAIALRQQGIPLMIVHEFDFNKVALANGLLSP